MSSSWPAFPRQDFDNISALASNGLQKSKHISQFVLHTQAGKATKHAENRTSTGRHSKGLIYCNEPRTAWRKCRQGQLGSSGSSRSLRCPVPERRNALVSSQGATVAKRYHCKPNIAHYILYNNAGSAKRAALASLIGDPPHRQAAERVATASCAPGLKLRSASVSSTFKRRKTNMPNYKRPHLLGACWSNTRL